MMVPQQQQQQPPFFFFILLLTLVILFSHNRHLVSGATFYIHPSSSSSDSPHDDVDPVPDADTCTYSSPCSLNAAVSKCNNLASGFCTILAFAGTFTPSNLPLIREIAFAPVVTDSDDSAVLFQTTLPTGQGFIFGPTTDSESETESESNSDFYDVTFDGIDLRTPFTTDASEMTQAAMFAMSSSSSTDASSLIQLHLRNIHVHSSGGLFAAAASTTTTTITTDDDSNSSPLFRFQLISLESVSVDSSHKPIQISNQAPLVKLNVSRCSFVNSTRQGLYVHNLGEIDGVVSHSIFRSNWNYYVERQKHFGGGLFIRTDDANANAEVEKEGICGDDGVALRVRIENCTFSKNWAIKGGGAFLMSGGEGDLVVDISGCRFEENLAMYLGGGIYVHAPFGSLREMNLTDCAFDDNVSYENGGAVILFVTLGDIRLHVLRSTFLRNSASKDGGALYALVSSGNIDCLFDYCEMAENSAVLRGGGWYLESCSRNVTTTLSNSILRDNSGFFGGGYAALSSDMSVLLSNATFVDNHGFLGAGGFQFAAELLFRTERKSEVSKNQAKNNGGGFFVAGREVDVQLSDSLFDSNGASNGAGLYLLGNSHVQGYFGPNVKFSSNVATQVGGAVSVQYSSDLSSTELVVGGSTFDSNGAGTKGGALALQPTSTQDATPLDQGAVGELRILAGSVFESNIAPSGSAISAIFHLLTVSINETEFVVNSGPSVTRSECTVCLTGATDATFINNVWDNNVGTYSGLYFQNSPRPADDGVVKISHATVIGADSNFGVYGFASGFKSVVIDDVHAQYCNNGLVSFDDGEDSLSKEVILSNFRIERQRNSEVRRSIVGFKKDSIEHVQITGWDIQNDDVSPLFKAQSGFVEIVDMTAKSDTLVKCFEGISGLEVVVVLDSHFTNCDFLVSDTDVFQMNGSSLTEGVLEVDGECTSVAMKNSKVLQGRGVVLMGFESFYGSHLELIGNNNSNSESNRGGGLTAIFSESSREFVIGPGCAIKMNEADMGGGILLKGDNQNCQIVLGMKDQFGQRSEIMKNTARFGSGVFVELSRPEKLQFQLEVLLNRATENPSQVYFVEQNGRRIHYDLVDPHDLVEGDVRFDCSPVSFTLVTPKLECYYEESDARLFACYLRHVQYLNNDGSVVTILPPEVKFKMDCHGFKFCEGPQIQYWDHKAASVQFYVEYVSIADIPDVGWFNISMVGFDGVLLQSSYQSYKMFACKRVTDHFKCQHGWSWEIFVAIIGGSFVGLCFIVVFVLSCLVYCQFGTIILNFFKQLDEGQVRKRHPWKLMTFQMCLSRVVFDLLFCCACNCRNEMDAWKQMATVGESAVLRCCCCCCRARKPKYAVDIGRYDATETLLEEHLDDEDLVQDLTINYG